jgi:hypothetical protein
MRAAPKRSKPSYTLDDAQSRDNCIQMYWHCRRCLAEKPEHISPREWAQIEVGTTELGLQVWCKRHNANVAHIDFEGHVHPASLHGNTKQDTVH